MKKTRLFFQFVGIGVFAISLLIASCTKEGPMGAAGADGTDGVDGTNGTDGTTSCVACHNETTQTTIAAQYASSTHGGSQNFYPGSPLTVDYAGGRNNCAKCHSHEGFVETLLTGMDTTAAAIPLPTNITCNTCHSTHGTFDFETDGADYALATNIPVALLIDKNSELDFGNNSNLCANCHQPRTGPTVADVDGNFAVTSSRYGPHHSPQATMVAGVAGYETLTGSYPPAGEATHATAGACVLCHMADKDNVAAHDWVPTIESCQACHESLTTFDHNGFQTKIQGLIDDLKAELTTAGLLDVDGNIVLATYPAEQAGALYNYKTVLEDQSLGVHNPGYTEALLVESIAIFD